MATIALRDILLYDRWPGYPDPNLSCPSDGFDSSAQCSSTPVWPVGTKIQAYNDSTYNAGYYTMQYLRFVEGSDSAFDAGDPSTGYCACFHIVDASQHSPGAGTNWYLVTHDLTNSDGTLGGAVAFPAFDLSGNSGASSDESNEYGWFWVGGVNPCITNASFTDCTRLAGEILTDGNVVIGQEVIVQDDGTNAAALALACPTVFDSTTISDASTWGFVAVGRALATDA